VLVDAGDEVIAAAPEATIELAGGRPASRRHWSLTQNEALCCPAALGGAILRPRSRP
jgi:hypothetical protein